MKDLTGLQNRLGYRFSDETLLQTALTHPSYGRERHTQHYQRLEFLGDAVLEMAVSRYLYTHHPNLDEGQLTRFRAALVCEETLCEAARQFNLPHYMRLSYGEERCGGRGKASIIADILEAVIAAIYLDGGVDAAFELAYRALGPKLNAEPEDVIDAKSTLQELLQQENRGSPVYELVSASGPAHKPQFAMRVLVDGCALGEGTGQSKQLAQQRAAREALAKLRSK